MGGLPGESGEERIVEFHEGRPGPVNARIFRGAGDSFATFLSLFPFPMRKTVLTNIPFSVYHLTKV
jgi:hypothetical protein